MLGFGEPSKMVDSMAWSGYWLMVWIYQMVCNLAWSDSWLRVQKVRWLIIWLGHA
jgi:hypothetical protein